jgi:hypothetical protein
MTKMPSQLLVWTLLGATLGTLGVLSALMSCSAFAMPFLFDAIPTTGMSAAQEEVYRELLYNSVKWAPLGVVVGFFKIPLGIMLMLGGGLSVYGKVGGDVWLRRSYRYGMVFEPFAMIVGIAIAVLSVAAMDLGGFLETFTGGANPGAAPPLAFADATTLIIMWGSIAIQFVFIAVWTATKMGFYWWGLKGLKTEESKAFFTEHTH